MGKRGRDNRGGNPNKPVVTLRNAVRGGPRGGGRGGGRGQDYDDEMEEEEEEEEQYRAPRKKAQAISTGTKLIVSNLDENVVSVMNGCRTILSHHPHHKHSLVSFSFSFLPHLRPLVFRAP